MKPKGSGFTLVGYTARLIDDKEAVRPAGVGALRGILQIIYESGNVNAKFDHASIRGLIAIIKTPGGGDKNVVLNIAGHLPSVGRMRLFYVYDIQSGSILVLRVHFVEGGDLPPKGRSSMTAENQDHRLLAAE
jgi:hypothetical protein